MMQPRTMIDDADVYDGGAYDVAAGREGERKKRANGTARSFRSGASP